RPDLYAPLTSRAQMVGRTSLHLRGLPLLVRGRRTECPVIALGPARIDVGAKRGTTLRSIGRRYDSLRLDASQSIVFTESRRGRSVVHFLPVTLSEAIP